MYLPSVSKSLVCKLPSAQEPCIMLCPPFALHCLARSAGHSLGGAMAILAAHDVASQCGVPTVQARSCINLCWRISVTLSLFYSCTHLSHGCCSVAVPWRACVAGAHIVWLMFCTLNLWFARKLALPQVYTFGAPRPGDANFARECNQLAPDMWQIINDAVRRPACTLVARAERCA